MSYQFDENVENEVVENRNKSPKKILMLVAFGVVVLTTIVVVSFLTKGNTDEPQEFAELDSKLEKVVEEVPQNNQTTQDPNAEIEQFMQDLQTQREKNATQSELSITEEIVAQVPTEPEKQLTEEEEKPKKIAKIEKPKPQKQQTQKQTTQASKNKSESKPKAQQSKSAPSSVVQAFSSIQTEPQKGLYLQVASFVNQPNTAFLEKIKKYSYSVQKVEVDGKIISKYLVGPFASRDEAHKQVPTLTEEFQRPFVVEIK